MQQIAKQTLHGLIASSALVFSIGALAQATLATPATPATPGIGTPGQAQGHGGQGRHHGERGQRGDKLKKLDVNGDGAIDKAEVANHPRLSQRFDQLDANKDGKLTRDEMRAARDAHKGPHGGQRTPS